MSTPDPLWERLRQLREAAGMTRDELARLAGVGAEALGRCETGRHQTGSLDTIRRVAGVLGHTVTLAPDPAARGRFEPRRTLRRPPPSPEYPDGEPPDEVAVDRAIAGQPVTLGWADRQAVITDLVARGTPIRVIADRLHLSARHVQRLRDCPQPVDTTVDNDEGWEVG